MKTTSAVLVHFYCHDKTSQPREVIEDKADIHGIVCAGTAKAWESKEREESSYLKEQTLSRKIKLGRV